MRVHMENTMKAPERFYDEQYRGQVYAPAETPDSHPYVELLRAFVTSNRLENLRCLEVGCGRGAFQDVVSDWTGVDVAGTLAAYIRKKFVVADAGDLPFADSSFDAAWSINALEHVARPERAMRELRRVVRDGGHILLAPAWQTRSWFAEGYPVRPYRDVNLYGKMIKASIPIRDMQLFRYAGVALRRLWGTVCGMCCPRTRQTLRYRRLRPNYDVFWVSDSDACNSLDQWDVATWFTNQGDACVTAPTWWRRVCSRDRALQFIVNIVL